MKSGMNRPVHLKYLDAVRGLLEHFEQTQQNAVSSAAEHVSRALTGGGVVRCAGMGHGVDGDFINRAGGLAAVQPFKFDFSLNEPLPECLRNRPQEQPFDREIETVRFAVRASHLKRGDVVLIGSVSGRNRAPVELALCCRERGVVVIGFTSLAYTARVTPLHPSGKKLADASDVVVDIGVPYGDAAVEIPGIPEKMLPLSGVAMTIAGWMIWGAVMEKMAASGNPPTVFISINREDGKAFYDTSVAQYNRRGY